MNRRLASRFAFGALACLLVALVTPVGAQELNVAGAFAPAGTLGVGVLMVPFLASEDASRMCERFLSPSRAIDTRIADADRRQAAVSISVCL